MNMETHQWMLKYTRQTEWIDLTPESGVAGVADQILQMRAVQWSK